MNLAHRKLENAVLVIICIGFVVYATAFIYRSSFIAIDGDRYFCLFDDAMISMRYAWNFSHGLGLVWNQDEYIQGYTNLLMTLLMSFATLVFDKSTAALFIQILGVGFMLAIAFVNLKISDHIFQHDHQRQSLVRILSFLGGVSYYPLVYWTLMGMETGMLTLLVLLGILFALKYTCSNSTLHLFEVSGFFGLAFLTRNDSVIFAILTWAYIIWECFIPMTKFNPKSLMRFFASIGFYLVFVVGQLIFQYSYYGEILPNTYTLKLTGMPLLERMINGIGFVTPFLIGSALILVLASMEIVFDFQKRKLLLFSIVSSTIGYEVWVGGDPWNYWRLMSPAMPLLILLFISAANAIVLALSSTQAFRVYFFRNPIFPEKSITPFLVVSLTLIGLLLINRQFMSKISLLTKPWETRANELRVNTAIALNHLTTSEATIGVYAAGTIPYFADKRAIDFLGKSDRYIAQLPPDVSGSVAWSGMNSVPGHNKYDLNYSIKILQPTYVEDFTWGAQDLSQWSNDLYVKVEYHGISLFLLRGSPLVYWNRINMP